MLRCFVLNPHRRSPYSKFAICITRETSDEFLGQRTRPDELSLSFRVLIVTATGGRHLLDKVLFYNLYQNELLYKTNYGGRHNEGGRDAGAAARFDQQLQRDGHPY